MPEQRYKTCVPLVPLKAAAVAFSDPQHIEDDEKAATGDSGRLERVVLKPVNSDFKPIVLTDAAEGGLQVIAELIEVLSPAALGGED